jgi:hypothetical protein
MKWNREKRSRKSTEQAKNFQDQHYGHNPHFDYQVGSVDKEQPGMGF